MTALELFLQGIREKGRGAIIATVILFFYVFWIGTMYPEVSKLSDAYSSLIENPAMKAFLGDAAVSLTSYGGFLGIEIFSYMGIVLGGYIAFMTASFIAGEIEQKTSEMLLSLPVKRETIVLSRYAVIIPVALLMSIGILGGAVAGAEYINEDIKLDTYVNAGIVLTVFVLATGSISLFISSMLSDSKQAALASLGLFILMYFTENIGSMVKSIEAIRSLCLFHYIHPSELLMSGTMNWNDLGVLVVVAVLFLGLAVLNFRRREINTV
jgi:ABC-2 type transport system permease protein